MSNKRPSTKEFDIIEYELWKEVERQLRKIHGKEYDVLKIIKELIRGLTCKAHSSKPMELSFPAQIDEAWHFAILQTAKYSQICKKKFGKMIEHSTETDDGPIEVKMKRIQNMKDKYEEIYDEKPPKEIWDTEEIVEKPSESMFPGSTRIYVRMHNGKTLTIGVELDEFVWVTKLRIQYVSNKSIDKFRLLLSGNIWFCFLNFV